MLYDVGKNPPAGNCGRIIGKRIYTASIAIAIPWPPPMQRDANPRLTFRRFISLASASTIRAPEQPTGWPMEMADPLTLVMSQGMFNSRRQEMACAANASLSSKRP